MTAPATPFLAVDLEVLDANIERTAAWASARGLVLRPHVKTHKCPKSHSGSVTRAARG